MVANLSFPKRELLYHTVLHSKVLCLLSLLHRIGVPHTCTYCIPASRSKEGEHVAVGYLFLHDEFLVYFLYINSRATR
jgi:hypothetical protein